jgi:nitrogenase-associated protein
LLASGHTLEVRSILSERWEANELAAFFGARPVSEWFNSSSPRIKSGEVRPELLNAQQALALMLADPLLIRRPLMEIDGRREAGFDDDRIDAWIGLARRATPMGDTCIRERGQGSR